MKRNRLCFGIVRLEWWSLAWLGDSSRKGRVERVRGRILWVVLCIKLGIGVFLVGE